MQADLAIWPDVLAWIGVHGVRVLVILLAAAAANWFLRAAFKANWFFPSILDNIPGAKYKEIIGQAQRRRIQTVVKAVRDTLSFMVYVIAAVTLLPEFGINVAPIIAGLGLAGLAIGMAAKDIFTDFLAGFFIIVEGEYSIGDEVKVADVSGKVLSISLRRTILRDENGDIYFVPNGQIKSIMRKSVLNKEEKGQQK